MVSDYDMHLSIVRTDADHSRLPCLSSTFFAIAFTTKDCEVLSPDYGGSLVHCHLYAKSDEEQERHLRHKIPPRATRDSCRVRHDLCSRIMVSVCLALILIL